MVSIHTLTHTHTNIISTRQTKDSAHVIQGRKKKPFIDKNKATKFHLVPRSQADPLLGDPLEPQHVLKPEQVGREREPRERENHC